MTKRKALVGNLTGKHVVGSLRGAAATIAVSNTMRFRGWGDVMGSGAVAIGGRIAVKQMDESAGDTFILTRLNIISMEISPVRPGKIQQDIKVKKVYTIKEIFTKKSVSENMSIKNF